MEVSFILLYGHTSAFGEIKNFYYIKNKTQTTMEINKMLRSLPTVRKCKDGDEVVVCRLTMFYDKSAEGTDKWHVGYFSVEHDYWLMVGRGETLGDAVYHLKRQNRSCVGTIIL